MAVPAFPHFNSRYYDVGILRPYGAAHLEIAMQPEAGHRPCAPSWGRTNPSITGLSTGYDAASFVQNPKRLLEHPALMFMA